MNKTAAWFTLGFVILFIIGLIVVVGTDYSTVGVVMVACGLVGAFFSAMALGSK